MAQQFTAEKILALPIGKNDARGAKTIGDYLIALLAQLWKEKGGFSGTYPFGNSGWEHHLRDALVEAGAIKGEKDDRGEWIIGALQINKADALIMKAIKALRLKD